MRTLLRFLAVLSVAGGCTQPSDADESSTGPVACSAAGCACEDACDEGLVCASQICVLLDDLSSSSGEPDRTTGESDTTSGGTSGWASSTSSDSSGEVTSTGSTSTASSTGLTGSSGSTGPSEAFCGDGTVDDGEECDDGNIDPGDGCDAVCTRESWKHFGIAHDVPVADLHGWTECWADDYSGNSNLLVSSLAESCTGAHLLMACRPIGADALTLAAHAPREDVMFPVKYSAGERHEANGVAWYWAPKYDDGDRVGFAPAGNAAKCGEPGADQLCWRTQTVDSVTTFTFGSRCGAQNGFTDDEAPMWQRVAFTHD